ncbi:hypothetical protein B0H15DRAFT_971155 [Mycena belliarum]|uniref:Uncharacterized protein n=1 Tax=Mycena belliarum TaxID=1033014 RepID=A0AAD6UB09_9AGAR|nr:hypothetical protein B0H15DRAFT_971155 [Mycena belliae]
MPAPTFTTERAGTVPLLNERTAELVSSVLSPTEQKEYILSLEALRADVEARGSSMAYFEDIGVTIMGADAAGTNLVQTKAHVLDFVTWQLATALRHSTPTRIAEAVPHLQQVIAYFDRHHPGAEKDVTPLMYLGVALHKQPGKESEAAAHFRAAYAAAPAVAAAHGERIAEAKKQERAIRDWLQWHPFGMPPREFVDLVTDPLHEGPDYILDHPLVKRMFDGMVEVAPGMVVHFG